MVVGELFLFRGLSEDVLEGAGEHDGKAIVDGLGLVGELA